MSSFDKEALEAICAMQSAQQAYLSTIYYSLHSEADITHVLESLSNVLPNEMRSLIAAVYVTEPGEELALMAYAGVDKKDIALLNTFYDHDFLLKEATKGTKKIVYLSSGEELMQRANIHSGLIVPLLSSTECIGVLFVGFCQAKNIDKEIAQFIQNVGIQIGQTIALNILYRKVKFSEMRYRKLLENASNAIFVADLKGIILETNKQGEILVGSPREEIIGKRFKDYIISPYKERIGELTEQLKLNKFLGQTVVQVQRKNGEIRTIEGSGVLVEIEEKPLMFMIVTDITELDFLRTQMVVADKLSTIGLLAAGVAHEINNPMACILANLDFMSKKTNDASLKEIIHESLEAGNRVKDIVKELNVYPKKYNGVEAVNVCEVLDSAVNMTFSEWKDFITIEKYYDSNIPEIVINRGKLHQVFLNLIINAIQSMKKGDLEKNKIKLFVKTKEDKVIVEVEDTGEGVAFGHLKRIFDPFFTTKPMKEGTGLGLFICHEIIKNMQGSINVKSKEGMGSKFIVELPIKTT